jgi:hypothetical protein
MALAQRQKRGVCPSKMIWRGHIAADAAQPKEADGTQHKYLIGADISSGFNLQRW